MSVTQKPKYIKEPTPLQYGQAVLAMLADVEVEDIVKLLDNARETTLKEMFFSLEYYSIKYIKEKKTVYSKEELPNIAVLSLETPRCWHWSLYFDGVFYDPEHGILNNFPTCNRKYYWEILK